MIAGRVHPSIYETTHNGKHMDLNSIHHCNWSIHKIWIKLSNHLKGYAFLYVIVLKIDTFLTQVFFLINTFLLSIQNQGFW